MSQDHYITRCRQYECHVDRTDEIEKAFDEALVDLGQLLASIVDSKIAWTRTRNGLHDDLCELLRRMVYTSDNESTERATGSIKELVERLEKV